MPVVEDEFESLKDINTEQEADTAVLQRRVLSAEDQDIAKELAQSRQWLQLLQFCGFLVLQGDKS